MKLLALDTSTEYLSLALSLDGNIFTRDVHAGQTHSQLILPLLRELLDEADVTLQALDGIAFGAGPGSFTGLRIACGVAQGLAFGADIPVAGISTLMALAQADGSEKVMACMDARMGEIYHAAYLKSEAGWDEASPVGLSKPEAMPELKGEGWVGVGNGWQSYAQQLAACYGTQVGEVFPEVYPQASAIAELARPLFEAGLGRPAAEAAPIYIRNKVALKTSERELAKSMK
jgi:tRNA threonylcarbamoyladenosine biosynthesis protein TsaB